MHLSLLLSVLSLLLVSPQLAHADLITSGCTSTDVEFGAIATKFLTRISFIQSGFQLKITNSSSCNYLALNWDKLEEVDIYNNTIKKINNFASQAMAWSNVVSGIWGNYSFERIDLTGFLLFGNGAFKTTPFFNISIVVFNTSALINNGNSTDLFPVPAGSAKVSFTIKNWPFASTNNSLRLGVAFTYGGGSSQFSFNYGNLKNEFDNLRAEAAKYGTQLTTTNVGPGRIDSPWMGFVDGKNCSIGAQAYNTSSGSPAMQWVFPYFATTLFYDPVVSTDAATTTSSTTTNAAPEASIAVTFYNAALLVILATALFVQN